MLLDNGWHFRNRILNNATRSRITLGMKQILYSVVLVGSFTLAASANAACYADYKAKQDNPLRLHYGVAQVQGACSVSSAKAELSGRLASRGWTLLNVLTVFGNEGLAERRDSAGAYFLRF